LTDFGGFFRLVILNIILKETEMFCREKDKPMYSKGLMMLSVVAVLLAVIGALGNDIILASTQWLLVAGVLAAWGVYLLLEAEFRS
jgi:pheromone shutdown protein TraB